jgi:chaperonin GroES
MTTASDPNPGISPVEFNVLVRPREAVRKTAGGVIIPDMAVDKQQAAAVEGTIVAVSPLAFSYDDWPEEQRPVPGDSVVFAKYAGMTVTRHGVDYRLIKDKDIAAVLKERA